MHTIGTALWWIRRDLRLGDNQALVAALAVSERVIPVFVLDPVLLNSRYSSVRRVAFMLGGLRALDRDLRSRGSRLVVRRGVPREQLASLVKETGATAIFAEQDHSPYATARDADIAERHTLHLVGSTAIRPPGMVLKSDGRPYTVFTPFSRAWLAMTPLDPNDLLAAPAGLPDPGSVASHAIPSTPELPADSLLLPGEAEAERRLRAFLASGIHEYGELRNRVDLNGTSRLSPYLRFGMLSPRRAAAVLAVYAKPGPTRPGPGAWLNELIWRDFYIHILHYFPEVKTTSFKGNLRAIQWRNCRTEFDAWCHGRTGYPIVDAAMRQLAQTGWLHNRARMIVASFLVKDLLVDWRWGEEWFMQHLLDGDPACNNGGWQWTAGTGTDAAPYFRIFNPITQGKKFDPEGAYVRRWVPELRRVPTDFVHEPWRMRLDEQRSSNCLVGQDYPRPIVDHFAARERTLRAYGAAGTAS